MIDFPILSVLLAIPVLGILFMSLIRANNAKAERNLKQTALWISFLNFIASLALLFSFNLNNPEFQFVEHYFWLDSSISYHLGVDGISILLIVLTTLLLPICILASYDSIQFAVKDEKVYVIEANPRSSRTVPFIAKAYDEPYPNYAVKVMLGENKLKDFKFNPKKKGFAIKIPVFSFNKFAYIFGSNVIKASPKQLLKVI